MACKFVYIAYTFVLDNRSSHLTSFHLICEATRFAVAATDLDDVGCAFRSDWTHSRGELGRFTGHSDEMRSDEMNDMNATL